jgi:D-alanyl-D-alanine dipeptidase
MTKKTNALTIMGLLALVAACKQSEIAGSEESGASQKSSLAQKLEAHGLVKVGGGIVVDLAYTKEDPSGKINFLKKNVYGDLRDCYLRPEVAAKLNSAQIALKKLAGPNATLVLYDCARPLSVQKAMWAVVANRPDAGSWVANPATGSKHNFGASIDLTFRNQNGKIADMGSRFDEFSPKSVYDAPGVNDAARAQRKMLRDAMMSGGLLPYNGEWWHFDGHPNPRSQFPILDF